MDHRPAALLRQSLRMEKSSVAGTIRSAHPPAIPRKSNIGVMFLKKIAQLPEMISPTGVHPIHRPAKSAEIFTAEEMQRLVFTCEIRVGNGNKIRAANIDDRWTLRNKIDVFQQLADNGPIYARVVLRLDGSDDVIFKTIAEQN